MPIVQQPSVSVPAPALYPHQIAYQQQQLSQALQPPQQSQIPQQARPPQQQQIPQQLPLALHPPQMQAGPTNWQQLQRAASYDGASSAMQPLMAGHPGAASFCESMHLVQMCNSVLLELVYYSGRICCSCLFKTLEESMQVLSMLS